MAKPKRPPVKAKPRKPRPLTATQQARNVVRPQYGAIDLAQSRSAKQARQQQAALTAARDALVTQLQAGVGTAGQQYDAALDQQQALANAGAEGLAAANPNQQIQDTLQSIGAPVEQQQQLGALTQGAFPGQGAVLRVQEGTVPGASLVAQKAAVQQFAAGQPTLAGLSGDLLQKSLVAQAQAQRDQYLADRMKIAGQIPGLALDIQEGMDARQAAALDRTFRAQQAKFDRQLQRAQLAMEREKLNAALMPEPVSPLDIYKSRTDRIAARNARREATQGKRYAPEIVGSAETGYFLVDPNTGRKQKVVPGTGSGAEATGGGRKATANQIQDFADLAYYGKQPSKKSIIGADGQRRIENVGGILGIGYQKALFRLMHTYNLKLADAQGVLDDYYAPGERGRPVRSYQERGGRPVPRRKKKPPNTAPKGPVGPTR